MLRRRERSHPVLPANIIIEEMHKKCVVKVWGKKSCAEVVVSSSGLATLSAQT